MFRLLGILAIGNLLFGNHHHYRHHVRRSVRRGLLLGALLGYLSNRENEMNRARQEAREAERAARDAARAAREEIRNARRAERDREIADRLNTIRAESEARRAEREARSAAREEQAEVIRALPVSGVNEAKEIEELVDGLEKETGKGCAAAEVPTIDFPEEEEKYHAARKYGYA